MNIRVKGGVNVINVRFRLGKRMHINMVIVRHEILSFASIPKEIKQRSTATPFAVEDIIGFIVKNSAKSVIIRAINAPRKISTNLRREEPGIHPRGGPPAFSTQPLFWKRVPVDLDPMDREAQAAPEGA
jgi:hypothetical protein